MRPEQKTKSRTKLYNAISGAKEITGVGGRLAVGSIQFANIPTAGETITIGGIWFEAQAGASEAAGTSAGTEADPHLFQSITDLATAGASLAAQVLAETATTGAWGYLYPDDSIGCDFTTDTLTLTFWPGTWANSITLAGSAGDETIVQPVTASLGRNAPVISPDVNINIIDTTGSTQNQEYYVLQDGNVAGESARIMVKTFATDDTPTVIGKFEEIGTAMVEMEFVTAEPGVTVELIWTGAAWELANYSAFATIPDFTAA
jgi:hypothetical protein